MGIPLRLGCVDGHQRVGVGCCYAVSPGVQVYLEVVKVLQLQVCGIWAQVSRSWMLLALGVSGLLGVVECCVVVFGFKGS